MKKMISFSYYLALVIAITVSACQKQKQEPMVTTVDNFSSAEKIIIPETDLSSSNSNGQSNNQDYNTFYGPTVQMGNGHLRSWINIRRSDDKPLAIGIEMTDNSLQGLPTDPSNFAASTFVLTLHQKARAITPFDHITINWEPVGHEPPHIYDVPHFDMHFYKISVADQSAITGVPGPAPAAGYLPASYVIRGATVPQMGTHWLNPASPELPPTLAPFTHTFIYGSNNGHVHFLEPMITRAFLMGGTSVNRAYPQPIHFSPAGTNYPSHYRIWKDDHNSRHYIALTDFLAR